MELVSQYSDQLSAEHVPRARSRTPSPLRSQTHNSTNNEYRSRSCHVSPNTNRRRNQSDPSPPAYENIRLKNIDDKIRFQITSKGDENEIEVSNNYNLFSPMSPPHQGESSQTNSEAQDFSVHGSVPKNFKPEVCSRQDSVDMLPLDPNLVCPTCGQGFCVGQIQMYRSHYKNCQQK